MNGILARATAVLLALSAAGPSQAMAEAPASAKPRAAFRDAFAEELLSTGDSFRALTVLKEREFSLRGTAEGLAYGRKALGLYLNAAEYDAADSWLTRLVEHYPGIASEHDVASMKAELSFLYGNYAQTERLLEAAPAGAREPLLSFAQAAKDPGSARVDPGRCSEPACAELAAKLTAYQGTPSKDPRLALALGLVPGLGQVYAGSPWGGLSSFVINGLLIGVTAYAAGHGEGALAVLTGVAGGGFYLGSLYAGYESARRYNEARAERGVGLVRSVPLRMELLKFAF